MQSWIQSLLYSSFRVSRLLKIQPDNLCDIFNCHWWWKNYEKLTIKKFSVKNLTSYLEKHRQTIDNKFLSTNWKKKRGFWQRLLLKNPDVEFLSNSVESSGYNAKLNRQSGSTRNLWTRRGTTRFCFEYANGNDGNRQIRINEAKTGWIFVQKKYSYIRGFGWRVSAGFTNQTSRNATAAHLSLSRRTAARPCLCRSVSDSSAAQNGFYKLTVRRVLGKTLGNFRAEFVNANRNAKTFSVAFDRLWRNGQAFAFSLLWPARFFDVSADLQRGGTRIVFRQSQLLIRRIRRRENVTAV